MWQQTIVFHLGADRQERRGQLTIRLRVVSALVGGAVRGADQLLINLRLALGRDRLIVRLVHALQRFDPFGTGLVPPKLTRQGLVVGADDPARAIGPARGPDHLAQRVHHLKGEERPTESDAGWELMANQVLDRDRGGQGVILEPSQINIEVDRTLGGLVEHLLLGEDQLIDTGLAEHRIGGADPQNVRELLSHLGQEQVKPHQGVPRETLPDRQIDLLGLKCELGLREVRIFLDAGDPGLGFPAVRIGVRHMAGLTAFGLRAFAARKLSIGRSAGAVGRESPFRIGQLLVDRGFLLVMLHPGAVEVDRQMHRVAGPAGLGHGQRAVVLGRIAKRMLHWLLQRFFERPIDLVRRADQEGAGEGFAETLKLRVQKLLTLLHAVVFRRAGIFFGFGLAKHHPMTGQTGDAVTSERAVIGVAGARVIGGIGNRVGHGSGEVSAALVGDLTVREILHILVDAELALPHEAVTTKAGVFNDRRDRLVKRLGLTGQLSEKDRITARKPHRRGAPGRVGRQVPQARLGIGIGLPRGAIHIGQFGLLGGSHRRRHVELKPGASGVVTAQALVRGEVLAMNRGASGLDKNVVIGLRRHLANGLVARTRRFLVRPGERFGEGRVIGVKRLSKPRREVAW